MRKIFTALAVLLAITSTQALAQSSQQFTVTTSGFTAPNGQPWTARGFNLGPEEGNGLQSVQGIAKNYPGTTMDRLVANANVDTLSTIDPVVQANTNAGIVTEIEDHNDSQNGDNTAWYTTLANAYKNNPFVFLETPNEPSDPNTAQHQIDIIKAIRAAGFNNPIGVQPMGGYDMSNIPTVTAAVGTTNLYVTPHIYFTPWQQTEIDSAKADGLFSVIDEFGNAGDGVTIDPQGDAVIQGVIQANQEGKAGAIFWAVDNGYHPDGADSAFMDPTGSQLTSTGKELQPWLSGSNPQISVNFTSNADGPTVTQGQQAVDSSSGLSVADVANLAAQGQTADGQSVSGVAAAAASQPMSAPASNGATFAGSTSSGSASSTGQRDDPDGDSDDSAVSGHGGAASSNSSGVNSSSESGASNQAQPIVLQSNAPAGTMPTPSPSTSTVTIDASGTNQTVTEPSGNGTGSVSGVGNSITATGGIEMLDVTGTGNTITTGQYDDSATVTGTGNVIDLGAGSNTITLDYKTGPTTNVLAAPTSPVQIDQAVVQMAPLAPAGNIFVAPQPGMGVLTIQGVPLNNGDTIDLTKALAGVAGWDHKVADIPQFVTVGSGMTGTEISVGGKPVVVLASGVTSGNPMQYLTAR